MLPGEEKSIRVHRFDCVKGSGEFVSDCGHTGGKTGLRGNIESEIVTDCEFELAGLKFVVFQDIGESKGGRTRGQGNKRNLVGAERDAFGSLVSVSGWFAKKISRQRILGSCRG